MLVSRSSRKSWKTLLIKVHFSLNTTELLFWLNFRKKKVVTKRTFPDLNLINSWLDNKVASKLNISTIFTLYLFSVKSSLIPFIKSGKMLFYVVEARKNFTFFDSDKKKTNYLICQSVASRERFVWVTFSLWTDKV